jgi:hypothetical protein
MLSLLSVQMDGALNVSAFTLKTSDMELQNRVEASVVGSLLRIIAIHYSDGDSFAAQLHRGMRLDHVGQWHRL